MSATTTRPRPATCSLHVCNKSAKLALWATDGQWWFCLEHAIEYGTKGYRTEPFPPPRQDAA